MFSQNPCQYNSETRFPTFYKKPRAKKLKNEEKIGFFVSPAFEISRTKICAVLYFFGGFLATESTFEEIIGYISQSICILYQLMI